MMKNESSTDDRIVDLVQALIAQLEPSEHPRILCFATGISIPNAAQPMSLMPEPASGSPFDENFAHVMRDALALNAASHDGAVLFLRATVYSPYLLAGWSYRLSPRVVVQGALPNRGSAYNSCLSMAQEPEVDLVVLASRHGLEVFGPPRSANKPSYLVLTLGKGTSPTLG